MSFTEGQLDAATEDIMTGSEMMAETSGSAAAGAGRRDDLLAELKALRSKVAEESRVPCPTCKGSKYDPRDGRACWQCEMRGWVWAVLL